MTKWILGVALVIGLLGTGHAEARLAIVLPHDTAARLIHDRGGFIERCERLAPRHIRCWAALREEQREWEEEDDGSVVSETRTVVSEPVICDVGLRGVRISPLSSGY